MCMSRIEFNCWFYLTLYVVRTENATWLPGFFHDSLTVLILWVKIQGFSRKLISPWFPWFLLETTSIPDWGVIKKRYAFKSIMSIHPLVVLNIPGDWLICLPQQQLLKWIPCQMLNKLNAGEFHASMVVDLYCAIQIIDLFVVLRPSNI